MFSIQKYIEQHFPESLYSPTFWANDSASPGVISIDLSTTGCYAVLYNTLTLANPSGAAQTVTITDPVGNTPLFVYTLNAGESCSISAFGHIVGTNQVSLTNSNPNVILSVGYQYITKKLPVAKFQM